MSFLPNNTLLGKLDVLEVFQYYDGPKLFSAYNKAGNLFIVFWLGDDYNEIAFDKWLYLPVSKVRLDSIKSGKIDLLTACRDAEDGFVWLVSVPFNSEAISSIEFILSNHLEDDDLPLAGSFLNIDTPTITEIEPIVLHAIRTRVDVLDISLDEFDSLRSEVGIKGLGVTMINVQNCVDSLYAASRGYKSRRIPEKIVEKSKLQAVDAFPSSFGIRLEAKESNNSLFDESELSSTLSLFFKLIELASQPDELVAELRKINSNVAVRYLSLFEGFVKSRISFKAAWGKPVHADEPQVAQISLEQANVAFEALRQSVEEYGEVLTIDCMLEAIDTRKRTFGLTDSENSVRYEGKIDEQLLLAATKASAKVPARYIASILQNQRIRPYTDQWEPFYTLLGLEEKQ